MGLFHLWVWSKWDAGNGNPGWELERSDCWFLCARRGNCCRSTHILRFPPLISYINIYIHVIIFVSSTWISLPILSFPSFFTSCRPSIAVHRQWFAPLLQCCEIGFEKGFGNEAFSCEKDRTERWRMVPCRRDKHSFRGGDERKVQRRKTRFPLFPLYLVNETLTTGCVYRSFFNYWNFYVPGVLIKIYIFKLYVSRFFIMAIYNYICVV